MVAAINRAELRWQSPSRGLAFARLCALWQCLLTANGVSGSDRNAIIAPFRGEAQSRRPSNRGFASGKTGTERRGWAAPVARQRSSGADVLGQRLSALVKLRRHLRDGGIKELIVFGIRHFLRNDIACSRHGHRNGLITDFFHSRSLCRGDLIFCRSKTAGN